MNDAISLRSEGLIAILTLNRPERRNAITPDMRDAIGAALDQVATNPGLRALVIRGEGGVFCGGGDIHQMGSHDLAMGRNRMEKVAQVARMLITGPTPIVACVEGAAFGAGLAIAVACDYVVAAKNARFCAPFSNLGLTVDWGLSWTLPRRVGQVRARQMSLLAEVLDADAALAAGLADEIASDGTALERAIAIAARYAAGAPLASAYTRLAFAAAPETPDAALTMEAMYQATLMQTADHREGIAAFTEKRSANFAGN